MEWYTVIYCLGVKWFDSHVEALYRTILWTGSVLLRDSNYIGMVDGPE